MCGFTDACPVNNHRSGTFCKFAQMRSTGDRNVDRKLLVDRKASERAESARKELETLQRERAEAEERRLRKEEAERYFERHRKLAEQRKKRESELTEAAALRLDDRGSKIATGAAAVLWAAILVALFMS